MQSKEYKRAYYLAHKEEYSQRAKEWRKDNPEKVKELNKYHKEKYACHRERYNRNAREYRKNNPDYDRNHNLKYNYGITLEDYNKIFNSQNGCCAICGKHQSEEKQSLSFAHCHTTNRIRGLLCHHCNPMLGYAKDNMDVLKSGIIYLSKFSNN